MPALPAPAVGDRILSRLTKWDGSPHWQGDYHYLGVDHHGHWLGAPAGTHLHRPGADFIGAAASARLVPHRGAYLASFNGPSRDPARTVRYRLYVDMTTEPHLVQNGPDWYLRAADLDLDVIQHAGSGQVVVDDADEFAEHQVQLSYPPHIIELAERTCAEVVAAIRSGAEPFASVGSRWLDRISDVAGPARAL